MAKIRDDLEGVVYVRSGSEILMLAAGSEVPDDVTVGSHLLAAQAESVAPKRRGRPPKAASNAGDEG